MLKVSVLVLTYNHEQFIGQALDSILSQQVDFDYEIVVGEDCSTDQTRAVVQDYERRYPGRVRAIYLPRNVGPGASARACWAACTGQYIALLEGDDYWTSPLKLAQQVACLDAEPSLSFCFHYVAQIRDGQLAPGLLPTRTTQANYHFADFLANAHAHTSSLLLRNHCRPLPDWLFTVYPIDFPLLVLHAEMGPARLLPEVMGHYRLHAASTWSSAPIKRSHAQFMAMYHQLAAHYASTRHARTLQHALCQAYLRGFDSFLLRHRMPHEAGHLLRQAARMPQAYTPASLRWLAGTAWHWLRQRYRPGPAALVSSPAT